MFGARFFGARFFGPRYFGEVGVSSTNATLAVTEDKDSLSATGTAVKGTFQAQQYGGRRHDDLRTKKRREFAAAEEARELAEEEARKSTLHSIVVLRGEKPKPVSASLPPPRLEPLTRVMAPLKTRVEQHDADEEEAAIAALLLT